jgi:hypothetical protein
MLALIAYHAPQGNRGTWFALSASFMNLALTAAEMISKYFNKWFVVSREVLDASGQVVQAADYSQLGTLLLLCMSWTFLIPLCAVSFLIKEPKKQTNTR